MPIPTAVSPEHVNALSPDEESDTCTLHDAGLVWFELVKTVSEKLWDPFDAIVPPLKVIVRGATSVGQPEALPEVISKLFDGADIFTQWIALESVLFTVNVRLPVELGPSAEGLTEALHDKIIASLGLGKLALAIKKILTRIMINKR